MRHKSDSNTPGLSSSTDVIVDTERKTLSVFDKLHLLRLAEITLPHETPGITSAGLYERYVKAMEQQLDAWLGFNYAGYTVIYRWHGRKRRPGKTRGRYHPRKRSPK